MYFGRCAAWLPLPTCSRIQSSACAPPRALTVDAPPTIIARVIEICRATDAHAAALLDLQLALDRESDFMLLRPGERDETVGAAAAWLADLRGPSYVLLAVAGDGLAAGYIHVDVLPYARARRTGYVVMGVRAAFAGRGLGRRLLRSAEDTARAAGLRRLELTVMCHNQRAIGLYRSCGYQVEGVRRSALDGPDGRIDEHYMGLLIA
jgi:ribosomal protein S18 acetylase RimI-like enzyme